MSKTKKFLLPFLITIITLLSSIALMGVMTNVSAYADSKTYFSDKEYTNSNYLLKPDGIRADKRIQDFSEEVKSASVGTSFPELSQVIPLKYLESSNEEDVFQYNGNEYGFYVAKAGNYFDVLLIDFVYEFQDEKTHSDLEYKIRIKPILQQTFFRSEDENGNYIWTKSELSNYRYYVANPRFLSIVQNENALNYEDNGYNKSTDDGVIIQQFRINYGKISYATEDDLSEIINEFGVDMLVDAGCSMLDGVCPGSGTVAGLIKDFHYLGVDIYETGKESTVLADNENNIETRFSKTEQRNNAQFKGYSRVAGFMPKEEIILSDANDSFAEMIVVLNDANYKSRLMQFCEFDIARRSGNYSSMEYVVGNWRDEEAPSLNFSTQRILFEDQAPEFEVKENNVEGEDISVYLLQNGKQTIMFEPEYSGAYKFDLGNSVGVDLCVADFNGNIIEGNGYYDLRAGEKYRIIVVSKGEKVITSLGISLADGKHSGTIYTNEQQLLKLNILQPDVYNLSTGSTNCLIKNIFTKTNQGLVPYSEYSDYTSYSTISIPLYADEYFVLLFNDSNQSCSFNFDSEICGLAESDVDNKINADGFNYVYLKFKLSTGNYTCTIPNAHNYIVLNDAMESIGLIRYSNGNFEFENSYNVVYIGVLASKGEVDIYLNLSEYSYTWKVDGKVVSNNVELERGNSYTIEFYINGVEQGDDFISYIDKNDKALAEGIKFSGNQLTLMDYCPIGKSFEIKYSLSASAESKSGLTITPKYTVTFEGINVTNDEDLTFNWVQTGDLAKIYYTLSNGTITCSGTIDTAGYISGKIYREDLTKFTSTFGISSATISIKQIGVNTSKGVEVIKLETSFTQTVHMTYGGGTGTKNDKFIISSNRHFKNLKLSKTNNNYFKITKYISLEGNIIDNFYGVIDNDQLIVIGWKPSGGNEMGIILHNYGIIKNLHVNIDYNFSLSGFGEQTIGGIVCYNESSGVIETCSINNELKASRLDFMSTVGGIVGVNNGTIRDCWATADVKTSGTFGVIAGINYGIITGCCGMGKITQQVSKYDGAYELSRVGGIAGLNEKGGKISNCVGGTKDDSYLRVVIDVEYVDDEALAPYSGPIAGENKGEISNCSNYGYTINTGNLHSWKKWFHTYTQLKNINSNI